MSTYMAKAGSVPCQWVHIDATGLVLGRLASEVAKRLRGKHKPEYTPHVDVGDYVVVTCAERLRVTGRKLADKVYHRHTGYPGGLKSIVLEKQLQQHPERVLWNAVRGMLPKGPLGRAMLKKLKIYVGPAHPHVAQAPVSLELPSARRQEELL